MSKNVTTIAVVAATAMAAFAGSASAGLSTDHLKCYKVKDSLPKKAYTATLASNSLGLPASSGCTIKVPGTLLCNPVVKQITGTPTPPGAPQGQLLFEAYMCYKVKCPKSTATVQGADQFGGHTLGVSTTKLLCSPGGITTPGA